MPSIAALNASVPSPHPFGSDTSEPRAQRDAIEPNANAVDGIAESIRL